VAQLASEWELSILRPFPNLSYNYAAAATCGDGSHAALKVWFPNERDFRAEAEALRLYNGDGAVRLLNISFEKRAMLLELAEPGEDLWQLENEEKQIELTGQIMRRLWRMPDDGCQLPTAAAQFERMASTAPSIAPASFPLDWVASAKAIFDDLEASAPLFVLHEDLHQSNILSAQREPWLAIDPHGLVGPRELDTIQIILNVLWREKDRSAWPRIISRYVADLAEVLDLDREQIRHCGVARAVQEAFWTLEDYGKGWEKDFEVVDAFVSARHA
jgi:streptomycin 6-kinase